MSKYIIDENGKVSFPHPTETNTFVVVQPADVEKLIANGKLTKEQIQKIRTNRKRQMIHNIPTGKPAGKVEPLGVPSVAGNSTPSKSNEPLPLPQMNFGKSKTSTNSKPSKSNEPLPLPVMKF